MHTRQGQSHHYLWEQPDGPYTSRYEQGHGARYWTYATLDDENGILGWPPWGDPEQGSGRGSDPAKTISGCGSWNQEHPQCKKGPTLMRVSCHQHPKDWWGWHHGHRQGQWGGSHPRWAINAILKRRGHPQYQFRVQPRGGSQKGSDRTGLWDGFNGTGAIICFFCNKPGHWITQCNAKATACRGHGFWGQWVATAYGSSTRST